MSHGHISSLCLKCFNEMKICEKVGYSEKKLTLNVFEPVVCSNICLGVWVMVKYLLGMQPACSATITG